MGVAGSHRTRDVGVGYVRCTDEYDQWFESEKRDDRYNYLYSESN